LSQVYSQPNEVLPLSFGLLPMMPNTISQSVS
jgi:hypothetical protein